ncbi:MAG TPA: HD domain-containing protein [Bacteroidales bacterium]|nr:HD domain-containing protein [Bacteroidales bacterium]HRZ49088.1 HD domain-containing protein [Bacteroidales bacterium]
MTAGLPHQDFSEHLDHEIFRIIAGASEDLGQKSYVIGGFVRDILLYQNRKDIDVVTLGSGIALARRVADLSGRKPKVVVYKHFGTAMLRYDDFMVEFVGARRESYRHDSRKPVVEDGTLEEDQLRRDFTINAMGISLNREDFGTLSDPFNGLGDLEAGLIRTPRDPEITFSDDPLRIFRAIRFASQLGFSIEEETFNAIENQRERISILSAERIAEEFNKMMLTPRPSFAFNLLDSAGILDKVLPELTAMKGVENVNGIRHKDNYLHTLEVLDNLAMESDDLWLRWAALLHDIAKPATKKFQPGTGWTFHGHEVLGVKTAHRIFSRLKLPLNEPLRFVQKMIQLHLRPIALVESHVTDSAVRRLLFEAGDDIDKLMQLCKADITSKNEQKRTRYTRNFEIVEEKLKEIEEKDRLRNWQPPVTGEMIMEAFGIAPSKEVGIIKTAIREAILDGIIPNRFEEAYALMLEEGKKLGL